MEAHGGRVRTAPVDVVIPVFNAADDVGRCVDSVLRHVDETPFRLVLIDDASPAPEIAAYFADLRRRRLPNVLLLRNRRNRGFTGTANRGMRLSRADVLLLNSDTLVTKGWLSALVRCAASSPDIGTATPFSNNAEICSFPRFCADNDPRGSDDSERVRAALSRAAVPSYPSLPTGVGFCLYIKRTLIDAVGVFDPAFGLGYGEENDLCMRAIAAGFRNVLCDDAYVVHLGGRSFAGQKAELGPRNLAVLVARHPQYPDLVREYIAGDPLRPLRDAAMTQLRLVTGPSRGVLHVLQSNGGGTERQVRALIAAMRAHARHYIAVAVNDDWRVEELRDDDSSAVYAFRRQPDESWPAFVGGIAATFGIDLVHMHNISQCRDGVQAAIRELDLPVGYTVHDLNFACPTITFLGADGRYCGGVTDGAACARCLGAQAAFKDVDVISWRARHGDLLARCAFLLAPSQWTAMMLARYFPGVAVSVVPHGLPPEFESAPARTPVTAERRLGVPDDGIPTVGILGAIGPDKGARRLERLVEIARTRGTRVRFVLIGYMDVQHGPWQSDDALLTVHGHYVPPELPALLLHYRVGLVAFPSDGPETFSLTLSEAWAAGRPALVPPFGALAERVLATGGGWVWSQAEWGSDEAMLERIAEICAAGNREALAAAGERARAIRGLTATEMAQRTLAHYDVALAGATRSRAAPLAAVRVRDALGYSAWTPPPVAAPPLTARRAVSHHVRRALQHVRRSVAANLLYRIAGKRRRP